MITKKQFQDFDDISIQIGEVQELIAQYNIKIQKYRQYLKYSFQNDKKPEVGTYQKRYSDQKENYQTVNYDDTQQRLIHKKLPLQTTNRVKNLEDIYFNPSVQQTLSGKVINIKGVTAYNWLVYDRLTETPVMSNNRDKRKEMASLTKIMTFYACIQFVEKYNIRTKLTQFVVPYHASQMIGTSANLQYRDIITIHQLFYALMLPSGNDAAVVLAEYFVSYIILGNLSIFRISNGVSRSDQYKSARPRKFIILCQRAFSILHTIHEPACPITGPPGYALCNLFERRTTLMDYLTLITTVLHQTKRNLARSASDPTFFVRQSNRLTSPLKYMQPYKVEPRWLLTDIEFNQYEQITKKRFQGDKNRDYEERGSLFKFLLGTETKHEGPDSATLDDRFRDTTKVLDYYLKTEGFMK